MKANWLSPRKTWIAFALVLVMAVAVACSSAPAAPGVTPDELRSVVQEAVKSAASGPSAAEIQAMIQSAVESSVPEGTSAADISAMVEAAVMSASSGGITASDISKAISEASMNALSAAQVEAIVAAAVMAIPEPAAPAPAAPSNAGKTLTAALDNVGSPLFLNARATFPDNMFNYYFGFQETLATWAPNSKNDVSNSTCEFPMLMTSWSYDLPANFDDPDNQGVITMHIRENVDVYTAEGRHSELTADDVAWSINDAGSDNPASTHSNTGEAYGWFKRWEAVDKYTIEAPFRSYQADWINGSGAGLSSMCGDTIGIVSKQLYDEIGDDILTTPHGTGPLYVKEWRPNERIEADARVDHWGINPAYGHMTLIQAGEASTRTAMLQTGTADIAMTSIQDVKPLQDEGFVFHDGLNQVAGNFLYIAGNYWSFEDPVEGTPIVREGFTPDADHPWIGDPRVDGDPTNLSDETDSMVKAIAFREALLFSIDRDLIAETIISGFGGPIYGGGHGAGVAFHHTDPEWQDRWAINYDPDFARSQMAAAGVEPGFEFEFYCPSGNGTSPEVCQAVAGMWETELGLKPYIDNTSYSSRRPTMVGRQINVPWMTNWGPNRNEAKFEVGGTIPVCCLWPIGSGGYNAGIEDNRFFDDFNTTRIQEKASAENLATREAIMDRWSKLRMGGGVVEVPTLIGINPETVESWQLRPWRTVNSFETVVLK
ncbi:MAG: ABC transporter substrate-binding protein [Chloroflexi bacterium]|nr:ABC transporter substrate-binding protein [Chloroflexota bacterium]